VHFDVAHEFPASCARVAAVLCDPDFQTSLDLPDLGRPEVLANTANGTTRVLRLRYEYIGHLDPTARKILSGRKLTWVQELRLDTATFSGTLSFSAEADANRLNGAATVVIVAERSPAGVGERSRRRIAGDLHVRVPIVGSIAEGRIVPGLVRRLDVEAAALTAELS
jgi:hypothetical protein